MAELENGRMRRSIWLLLLSGLLPIVALGGAFGVITLRSQRAEVVRGIETLASATAVVAGVRLQDGMREVSLITASPMFDDGFDIERFRYVGARIMNERSFWECLSVATPDGKLLFELPRQVSGQSDKKVKERESFDRVLATRKPVIGNLWLGKNGEPYIAVRAPVIRDGKIIYILSALLSREAIEELAALRSLPRGWRAGIVDAEGTIVASTSNPKAMVGTKINPIVEDARHKAPGLYHFRRNDGKAAVGSWAAISGVGWTAHASAPEAAYSGPATGALTLLIVIILSCLLLLFVLIRLLKVELRQYRAHELAEVQRQRMEALGQLTGGVAHDFNNLLTPILGGLDMLKRRVVDDRKALAYVDSALTSAERARSLVARLLAFSRRQQLAAADFDPHATIDGISDLLRRSVAPQAEVKLDLPQGLPLIHADPVQLELAILNLVLNARDAMPDGGIIRVSAESMEAHGDADLKDGRYVAIRISDSGSGMDAATMRHAIDPFFTTKAVGQGTGLGLSMVHGFAAQSGGVLRIESQIGFGTTATIILPCGDAVRAVVRQMDKKPAEVLRPVTILLVDDDARARHAVADMLREEGHRVTEADCVAQALSILGEETNFDLVITDFLMPGRTGADLIADMRRRGIDIPLLVVTGYMATAGVIPEGIPRITKPFRANELLREIAALLDSEKCTA